MDEKYITPGEFKRLVRSRDLIRLAVRGKTSTPDTSRRVIDALRDVNKKDPGFKYSCECSEYTTSWLFGYTDRAVFEEADTVSDNIIRQIRKELGLDSEDFRGYPSFATEPCVCPFSGE